MTESKWGAGFSALYERTEQPLTEAACWAHARRKFFDLHEATGSPIAHEALKRIGALYAIEADIRGRSPDERRTVREERTVPLLTELRSFLLATMRKVSKKSDLAGATHCTLAQWEALGQQLMIPGAQAREARLEAALQAHERVLRGWRLGVIVFPGPLPANEARGLLALVLVASLITVTISAARKVLCEYCRRLLRRRASVSRDALVSPQFSGMPSQRLGNRFSNRPRWWHPGQEPPDLCGELWAPFGNQDVADRPPALFHLPSRLEPCALSHFEPRIPL